jgi:hypothetical protein
MTPRYAAPERARLTLPELLKVLQDKVKGDAALKAILDERTAPPPRKPASAVLHSGRHDRRSEALGP